MRKKSVKRRIKRVHKHYCVGERDIEKVSSDEREELWSDSKKEALSIYKDYDLYDFGFNEPYLYEIKITRVKKLTESDLG